MPIGDGKLQQSQQLLPGALVIGSQLPEKAVPLAEDIRIIQHRRTRYVGGNVTQMTQKQLQKCSLPLRLCLRHTPQHYTVQKRQLPVNSAGLVKAVPACIHDEMQLQLLQAPRPLLQVLLL